MKIKVKDISLQGISDLIKVVADNVDVETRCFKKLNRKIGRTMVIGLIFGIAVELRFIEQNQKIAALDERISALNTEIEELRDKEGD